MRVYGIDFTSAPRLAKPIACAVGKVDGKRLEIYSFVAFDSLEVFDNFLHSDAPWVAGLDFPFGQPRRLWKNLRWPTSWGECAERVGELDKREFADLLGAYRKRRPAGDKHHLRETDSLAGALSPMMLYGTPVAKMFHQGVPRLFRSSVSVVPCRPRDCERVVVEAYPALVARRFIGRRSYKNDARAKQTTERTEARRELLACLASDALEEHYGVHIELAPTLAEDLVVEGSADKLDAVLCAVQAAWAWRRRDDGFGVPRDADALEGWIADPALGDETGAGARPGGRTHLTPAS